MAPKINIIILSIQQNSGPLVSNAIFSTIIRVTRKTEIKEVNTHKHPKVVEAHCLNAGDAANFIAGHLELSALSLHGIIIGHAYSNNLN